MDIVDKITIMKLPMEIPYPEGETTQREEMKAYKRYMLVYHDVYLECLVVFI